MVASTARTHPSEVCPTLAHIEHFAMAEQIRQILMPSKIIKSI
jgi:hypothetical protein